MKTISTQAPAGPSHGPRVAPLRGRKADVGSPHSPPRFDEQSLCDRLVDAPLASRSMRAQSREKVVGLTEKAAADPVAMRPQVVAPEPVGSLGKMQNSLPSGSASVIQPLPSGRR